MNFKIKNKIELINNLLHSEDTIINIININTYNHKNNFLKNNYNCNLLLDVLQLVDETPEIIKNFKNFIKFIKLLINYFVCKYFYGLTDFDFIQKIKINVHSFDFFIKLLELKKIVLFYSSKSRFNIELIYYKILRILDYIKIYCPILVIIISILGWNIRVLYWLLQAFKSQLLIGYFIEEFLKIKEIIFKFFPIGMGYVEYIYKVILNENIILNLVSKEVQIETCKKELKENKKFFKLILVFLVIKFFKYIKYFEKILNYIHRLIIGPKKCICTDTYKSKLWGSIKRAFLTLLIQIIDSYLTCHYYRTSY